MNKKDFLSGLRDGVPVGLGYFVVAFSLGITAEASGLSALAAFVASASNLASAGEYAGFTVIRENGSLIEMAVMIFVANCRYMLMSAALSQRLSPSIRPFHRFTLSYFVTDELFALNIARQGYVNPVYAYGTLLASAPAWAVGTAVGVLAGDVLPGRAVSALSVVLFGMFIAIIIPPAKKNRVIAGLVAICFALSALAQYAPLIKNLSTGTRTIILTVVISAAAAVLFPKKDEEGEAQNEV